MNKIRKLTFLFMPIFLVGCASMNSNFDCPNKPGVTCRSIDQVNDMVNRGAFSKERTTVARGKTSNQHLAVNHSDISGKFNSLRIGEQVVRLWVAPYQDVHGNYHNESTLYTVVRKNNWVVPKEVREEG